MTLKYEYTVAVNDEGGITLTPNEDQETVARTATIFDITDSARKLVADLERQIVLSEIAQMLGAGMPMPEPTQQDLISEALAKRAEEAPAEEA